MTWETSPGSRASPTILREAADSCKWAIEAAVPANVVPITTTCSGFGLARRGAWRGAHEIASRKKVLQGHDTQSPVADLTRPVFSLAELDRAARAELARSCNVYHVPVTPQVGHPAFRRRSLGWSSRDYRTRRAPGIQSNACAVIQLNSSARAKVAANFMPAGAG